MLLLLLVGRSRSLLQVILWVRLLVKLLELLLRLAVLFRAGWVLRCVNCGGPLCRGVGGL